MRHPFDGLISTKDISRRSALGAMAAAAAGLFAGAASAQVIATQAIGEGGGPVQATTLAIGEEGAATAALREAGGGVAQVTTEPFGEEAGKVVSRATPGLEDGGKPATEAKNETGVPMTDAINEQGGPATGALNEGGVATTRALNEEGAATKALGEAGGPGGVIVPVKPDSAELKPEQFKQAWADLADKDAAKGVQACAILYGAKDVVKFLDTQFKDIKLPGNEPADEQKINALITKLDADDFGTREQAEGDLIKIGPSVIGAVQAALKAPKSAEQKMRLARILEAAKEPAEWVQARRGLEVLVALKTDDSKALLTKLSKGPEKAWLTGQAKDALERASK